jgi:Tol biopolymer transport system component
MSTPAPHFFISYSREDADLQRIIIAELRGRGINVWVDVENLIPGSPAWEREVERSLRGAAGLIVLLSPDSNNSEWVRREISFAEQHEKRIFPVLIRGEEDDSIPLRLSSHQRVDLRSDFQNGMEELARALNDHLGTTKIIRRKKEERTNTGSLRMEDLRKYALPGLLALMGVLCLAGLVFAARSIYLAANDRPAQTATASPDPDPVMLATAVAQNTPETAIPIDANSGEPTGKIVYTCQIRGDEICIINADGSGWRQLTDTPAASSSASLSPDGQSVVFVSGEVGRTELYELDLHSGRIRQLTDLSKEVGSPEISPDNESIAFTYRPGTNIKQVWIMNRDGSEANEFYSSPSQESHSPTWSPDGTQILFAMGRGESNKLYIIGVDGGDPRLVNDTVDTRGRSDWSLHNLIAFDMGGPFQHEVYTMNLDGSGLHKFSDGDNAQGASFSPDGAWIAFTAYTDVANRNQASCEIFIMRVNGTGLRRLTANDYCDYQPRWGN